MVGVSGRGYWQVLVQVLSLVCVNLKYHPVCVNLQNFLSLC